MTTDLVKLVYERWCADLRNKDRSKDYIYSNFYELFEELKRAEATFEVAYAYLDPAIRNHYPSVSLIKGLYKNRPKMQKLHTEQEFAGNWRQLIKDLATNAFYDIYPLKLKDAEPEDEDNGKPKDGEARFGGWSAAEYRLQREHANSFKPVDFSKIK